MLEYPAYSGLLLEEDDSFYTVLDWNNGQKTHSGQERGKGLFATLKVKTKVKVKWFEDFCYFREWFWLLEWADVDDHLVLIGANTECSST